MHVARTSAALPPTLRVLATALAVALAITATSEARAESPVLLDWRAPAECPKADEIKDEVARLLGPRQPEEKPLSVKATVKKEKKGKYRVFIEVPNKQGPFTREIDATSCNALGQATALILAMTIDPAAVLQAKPEPIPAHAEPPPLPPPSLPAAPSSPAVSDAPQAPDLIPLPLPDPLALPQTAKASPRPRLAPPQSKNGPEVALVGFGLVDVATLPTATAGFGAGLSVSFRQLRAEAGLFYFPKRTAHFASLPTAGADVDALIGYATACFAVVSTKRLSLAPCGGLSLGRISGTSFGVTQPGSGSSHLLTLDAGGRLSSQLSTHLAVVLGLGAAFPLARPELVVTGLGALYSPTRVLFRLSTGVEVRF